MSADRAAGRWQIRRVVTRDGRELYSERRGPAAGAPTVVFEAGMGVSHHCWGAVVERVAVSVPTLAYDRSGLGRSPADTEPRRLGRLVDDLVDVVVRATEGPVVLVGHSWGGPIVRLAAAQLGDLVAGIVLVDQTEETCDLFFGRGQELQTSMMEALLPSVAGAGLIRPAVRRFAALLPEPSASGMRRDDGTVAAARAQQAELHGHLEDLAALRDDPPVLPDVPVTYISGNAAAWYERGRRPELVECHRAAAAALPQGRHVVAERSSHYVPLTEPQLVADEIQRIAELAGTVAAER